MQQQKLGVSSGLFPFLLLVLACYFTTGTDSVAISLTSSEQSGTELEQEPVKCKNEQGKDVDWFMVYKLPKNRTSSNPLVRAGLAYAYILPSTLTSSSSPTKDVRTTGGGGDAQVGNISAERNTSSLFSTEGAGSTARGHHPHHHDHEPGVGTTGTAAAASWTLSGNGIDSPGSMVGQTLGKVYGKKNKDDAATVAFLTYNDQPPVGPVIMSGGHSKGVVVTSLASGFWIQHSVPHFPLIELNSPHYQYPRTGESNGQIFHCISLPSAKDVDNLGRILEITKPHIANYSFPTDSLKNGLPQLMAIVNRHRRHHQDEQVDIDTLSINNAHNQINNGNINININMNDSRQQLSSPCVNEVDERACLTEQLNANNGSNHQNVAAENGKNWDLLDIRSAGGKSFRAYVKGPSFHEEIYSAWIAPTYRTQLKVQSWLNGPNPFPSNCSSVSYSVFNIQEKNIAGHGFSTHNDHSKWALSIEQPLVCISDLNRMEHQLKRGGVTVCFMDSSTWSTFNSSVIDVQPCPRLAIVADHPNHDVGIGNGSSSSDPTPNFGTDIANYSTNNATRDGGGEAAEVVSMSGAITNVGNDDDDDNDDIKMWIVGHRPDNKHSRPRHNSFHQKRQRKVKSRTYSLADF